MAFPAISCGVYGYPLSEAAAVSLEAVDQGCSGLREVHFVLFGDDTVQAYMAAAKSRFRQL